MILTILQKIGLNENEAKIYIASLELGSTYAGRIIKHCGLPRATVYDSLERLVKKGLINKAISKSTTVFSPEDPDRLEYNLESSIKAMNQAKNTLDNIMPQLKKIKNPYMRIPSVRMYEGSEGLSTVLIDSLNAKETIYTYSNVEDMDRYIRTINLNYLEKRKKKGVYKKGLIVDSVSARKFMELYDKNVTEIKFLKKDMIPFHLEMNIYDGKVSYITYRDKNVIGIIIEDEDIYRIHRSTFELIWNQS